ncbi:MAG TPA: hypothetical protein H9966_07840 [Candidatus Prevotella avicola]|uniref:Uncharacterized protein n=1 Tax=Candidatus Prevotella avicola TaxID=2838738 RepID=A0A9D2JX11_9BACT|nr:hypothetical protein [Candidatus Prevotella avicola]
MNLSVYIFGSFSKGYSQYPDDYSSAIFQSFAAGAKATTQIAIRRDGNLMYYGYIRQLEQGKYIGFCVVLNGLYLTQVNDLFTLFEQEIFTLVAEGLLIHFNERGEIETNVERLYLNQDEAAPVTQSLRAGFAKLESQCEPLPTVNYGISKDSRQDFTTSDDQTQIVQSSYTHGYTYVYKGDGYNTARLNSYKGVLAKSYKEKKELKTQYDILRKQHEKTLKEKKQFKKVLILTFIVVLCIAGGAFLFANLNDTKGRLSRANGTIREKNTLISKKDDSLSTMKDNVSTLESYTEVLRNDKEELSQKLYEICSFAPFVVKECTVTSTSFNFDYYAVEEKEVTVTLKAINERNSEVVSNSHTLTFYKGGGTKSLPFLYQLSTSQYYYVVLMVDGNIVAGKRW